MGKIPYQTGGRPVAGKASRQRRPEWAMYDIRNARYPLHHNAEHELFEQAIVEFTDIAGIECDYYIRDSSIELDTLYGESTNTQYLTPKRTKLVYEPTLEPTLTRGFGIHSEEVVQYAQLPKFTFTRDISAGYHPVPGDVLVTLWNNRAYEIADVGEEERIFQLKKMIWDFVLRAYRFSDQSKSSVGMQDKAGADIPWRGFTPPTNPPKDPKDLSVFSEPLTAAGDNEWLEGESEEIYDYDDEGVDTSIYGY